MKLYRTKIPVIAHDVIEQLAKDGDIEVTQELFEIDRNRFTCAGGTAAIDMMLDWIGGLLGRPLAVYDTVLDVTEPMGMETLIYFTMEGTQVCGRVNPNAGAVAMQPMKLRAQ